MVCKKSIFLVIFFPLKYICHIILKIFTLRNSFYPDWLTSTRAWALDRSINLSYKMSLLWCSLSCQRPTHWLSLWFPYLSPKPHSFGLPLQVDCFFSSKLLTSSPTPFTAPLFSYLIVWRPGWLLPQHLVLAQGPKLSCTNTGDTFKLYSRCTVTQSSL